MNAGDSTPGPRPPSNPKKETLVPPPTPLFSSCCCGFVPTLFGRLCTPAPMPFIRTPTIQKPHRTTALWLAPPTPSPCYGTMWANGTTIGMATSTSSVTATQFCLTGTKEWRKVKATKVFTPWACVVYTIRAWWVPEVEKNSLPHLKTSSTSSASCSPPTSMPTLLRFRKPSPLIKRFLNFTIWACNCPKTSPWYGPTTITAISNARSEEHTSELQSRPHLVCRLLLEKKKFNKQF